MPDFIPEQARVIGGAWNTFVANPMASTTGAYIKAGALIEREELAAQNACGLYYEIYDVRVLGALRGLLTKFSPEDRKVFEQAASERGHLLDDASYADAQKAYEECMAEIQQEQGAGDECQDDEPFFHDDDALPNIDEGAYWSSELDAAAAKEGWGLWETFGSPHGDWQVLMIDDAVASSRRFGFDVPQLNSDEQAWLLVMSEAEPVHHAVIEFMGFNNPEMLERMRAFHEASGKTLLAQN